MPLTLIPLSASSKATVLVNISMPPLETNIADWDEVSVHYRRNIDN